MIRLLLAVVAAAIAAAGAHAQGYPVRPVTLIVPFAAGGPADVTGRLISIPTAIAAGRAVFGDVLDRA